MTVLEEVYAQEERKKMELEDEKARLERALKTLVVAMYRVKKRRRTAQTMEAERKILKAERILEDAKVEAIEKQMADLEVTDVVEGGRRGLAEVDDQGEGRSVLPGCVARFSNS